MTSSFLTIDEEKAMQTKTHMKSLALSMMLAFSAGSATAGVTDKDILADHKIQ